MKEFANSHDAAHAVEESTYNYLCELAELYPKLPDCLAELVERVGWAVSLLVGAELEFNHNTALRKVKLTSSVEGQKANVQ